jgi:murein L,D-transpeptidase YcbB/YkuD
MNDAGGRARLALSALAVWLRTALCLALAAALHLDLARPGWAEPLDDRGPAVPLAPGAAPAADPALTAAVRDLARDGTALERAVALDPAILNQVYAERDYAPIWVNGAGLLPAGERLLAVMERVQRSGALPPSTDLAGASLRRGAATPATLAELELLLSSALAGIAVDPENLLALGPHPQVLADADSDNLAELNRWLPPDATFWRLRAAIGAYGDMADRGGWPAVNPGPKLEPGARDGRIVQVRQRLLASGDLSDTPADPVLYDEQIEAAVRAFQARHGLAVDGVIGHGTIDALNVPVEERLASMIFNLHRLHEQARDWGDDYVMVNVAGAQLMLVKNGAIAAAYNVIVGRRERRTPEVHSAINRLEFNPYWNVPSGIYAKDFLPKLRKDRGYLANYSNLRVYRAGEPANEVDPGSIDWFSDEARQMRLRLRQDPGPENALGPAKFLFPNPYDVYLHGTNKPSLFAKADRFLSSGCVRLPDPLGFAELLLRDDPNWSRQRIEAAVGDRRNRSVTLAEPLPVHLIYDTAWVDDAGTVQFRADVYGRDAREAAVAQRGGGKS